MTTIDEYARIAYDAYSVAIGGKAFNGDDLPEFERVPEKIRDAWAVAVQAVIDRAVEDQP